MGTPSTSREAPIAVGASRWRIPPRHLARLAALPVAAVVTYAALLGAEPSARAIRTYILEPVVGAQTVLGWALFVAAASVHKGTRPTPTTGGRSEALPLGRPRVYGEES